jgi:hypothetical protein
MHATLEFQRGPLFVLVVVFFLALMAALAPGLSEVDLSGVTRAGGGEPDATLTSAPGADGPPAWVSNPVEPPLTSMERAAAGG